MEVKGALNCKIVSYQGYILDVWPHHVVENRCWIYMIISPNYVSLTGECYCYECLVSWQTCKYGIISNHTVDVTAGVNSLWHRGGMLAFKKHLCTLKSVNFKNFMSEWNIHISTYGKILCVEFQRVSLKFYTLFVSLSTCPSTDDINTKL